MSADRPDPGRARWRRTRSAFARLMSGNLCRCGAYIGHHRGGARGAGHDPRRSRTGSKQHEDASNTSGPATHRRSDCKAAAHARRQPTSPPGPTSIDLMKGAVLQPRLRLVDVDPPARPRQHRPPAGRRRRPHRGAWSATPTSPTTPEFAKPLPVRRGGAAVGRLGPAAERRDRRRQSAPAHSLRLLLRPRERLQQTDLRRSGCDAHGRREPPARHPRLERGTASPPSRRTSASRSRRSAPSSRSKARPKGRREVALEALHRLPEHVAGASTPCLQPGELIVGRPTAGGRLPAFAAACPLPQGARPHLLRLCRRVGGRRISAWRVAAGSPRHASRLGGVALTSRGGRVRGRGGARRVPCTGTPPAYTPVPRRRRSLPPGLPATTPSRSNWPGASSYVPWPWPPRARPSACPPSPPPPSQEPPPMAEITLAQAPAHVRMGSSIGQPLTRREGVPKTTGAARFAADNHPASLAYAVLAVSSIARGRVSHLDVAAAKAHPGVIASALSRSQRSASTRSSRPQWPALAKRSSSPSASSPM